MRIPPQHGAMRISGIYLGVKECERDPSKALNAIQTHTNKNPSEKYDDWIIPNIWKDMNWPTLNHTEVS